MQVVSIPQIASPPPPQGRQQPSPWPPQTPWGYPYAPYAPYMQPYPGWPQPMPPKPVEKTAPEKSTEAKKPLTPDEVEEEKFVELARDLYQTYPALREALTPEGIDQLQALVHNPKMLKAEIPKILAESPWGEKFKKQYLRRSRLTRKLFEKALSFIVPDRFHGLLKPFLNQINGKASS